jgi:hypothetical protein
MPRSDKTTPSIEDVSASRRCCGLQHKAATALALASVFQRPRTVAHGNLDALGCVIAREPRQANSTIATLDFQGDTTWSGVAEIRRAATG